MSHFWLARTHSLHRDESPDTRQGRARFSQRAQGSISMPEDLILLARAMRSLIFVCLEEDMMSGLGND